MDAMRGIGKSITTGIGVGIGAAIGAIMLLLAAYAAAGMIGGTIPANSGWRQADVGVRIFIESNGVHTGIVVPVIAEGVDWRDLVRAGDIADPRYAAHPYLSFGWGDRAFYMETPTWADVRPLTILAAARGSARTVLHVDHLALPQTDRDTRAITLSRAEYLRLASFIRASLRVAQGRPTWHHRGYGAADAFYEANGRYSAVTTCNAWTGAALRHAGVRVGIWTPFPVNVLGWFAP